MRILIYFICLVSIFSSCNIINPDEELPAYIALLSADVNTSSGEGTASANISETWLYVNDQMNGAYSLATSVPVLGNGNTRITCFAGIKNNGIGSLRIRYPFYAAFDTIINLQPLQKVNLHPHYKYVSGLDIDNSRNFESKTNFENVSGNDVDLEITIDKQIVKEGFGSGEIVMDDGVNYFQLVDLEEFSFTPGNTVFLEMDYSCNNSFTIGCYAIEGPNTNKIGILTLKPTTTSNNAEWNKVYIDIGALALIDAGTDYYKLFIESTRYESATPRYYLDNMKLVKYDE